MTEFYIPEVMRGKTPDGRPYAFFRGIHTVPESLANHRDANKLGIKPVDEMTDAEWAGLALDKAKWLAAHRPQPGPIDEVPAETDDDAAKTTAQTNIVTVLAGKPADAAVATTGEPKAS